MIVLTVYTGEKAYQSINSKHSCVKVEVLVIHNIIHFLQKFIRRLIYFFPILKDCLKKSPILPIP